VNWALGKAGAEAFRAEHHLPAGCLDIFEVVDGLPEISAAYLHSPGSADALYIKTPAHALMVINVAGPAVRQRFSAGHELGHHVLHGRTASDLTIGDPDVYHPGKDPKEQAANAFAAYVLVPDADLHRLVGAEPVTHETVGRIAAHFGVAWMTAVYRLHNAHLIVVKQRDALCAIPAALQTRLITKAGGPPPGHEPGLPRELVDGALDLYSRGMLTEEKVASILDTTADQLRALGRFEPQPEPRTFDAEAADELLRQLQ
jgi:Zn-dependent peptidase ImmA (M78 family)